METEELQELARQFACPDGELGLEVGGVMNKMNAFINARSIEALKPSGGEKILEIGFGNGLLSQPIIDALGADGHFIGIEKSETLARQAVERFQREGVRNVTVDSRDYSEAAIEHGSLNGVLAVNLIYFIEDGAAFFAKLYDWLAPGGRAVIGVRSSGVLKKMPVTAFGFIIRTEQEIAGLLRDAGFAKVESAYHDEGTVTFKDMELAIDSVIFSAYK